MVRVNSTPITLAFKMLRILDQSSLIEKYNAAKNSIAALLQGTGTLLYFRRTGTTLLPLVFLILASPTTLPISPPISFDGRISCSCN